MEAINFAEAVREHEAATKKDARPSIAVRNSTVTAADPEEIPDDAPSSAGSDSGGESDQVSRDFSCLLKQMQYLCLSTTITLCSLWSLVIDRSFHTTS